MGGDGNDGGTKSERLVTNDGHQRRNNRPHAGDKLWGFHKNSAYRFLNRITRYIPLSQLLNADVGNDYSGHHYGGVPVSKMYRNR